MTRHQYYFSDVCLHCGLKNDEPCTAGSATQPAPVHGTQSKPVTEGLIALLRERDAKGRATYGTSLHTFNSRDPLLDALEEAIDQAQYLYQAVLERKAIIEAAVEAGIVEFTPMWAVEELKRLYADRSRLWSMVEP